MILIFIILIILILIASGIVAFYVRKGNQSNDAAGPGEPTHHDQTTVAEVTNPVDASTHANTSETLRKQDIRKPNMDQSIEEATKETTIRKLPNLESKWLLRYRAIRNVYMKWSPVSPRGKRQTTVVNQHHVWPFGNQLDQEQQLLMLETSPAAYEPKFELEANCATWEAWQERLTQIAILVNKFRAAFDAQYRSGRVVHFGEIGTSVPDIDTEQDYVLREYETDVAMRNAVRYSSLYPYQGLSARFPSHLEALDMYPPAYAQAAHVHPDFWIQGVHEATSMIIIIWERPANGGLWNLNKVPAKEKKMNLIAHNVDFLITSTEGVKPTYGAALCVTSLLHNLVGPAAYYGTPSANTTLDDPNSQVRRSHSTCGPTGPSLVLSVLDMLSFVLPEWPHKIRIPAECRLNRKLATVAHHITPNDVFVVKTHGARPAFWDFVTHIVNNATLDSIVRTTASAVSTSLSQPDDCAEVIDLMFTTHPRPLAERLLNQFTPRGYQLFSSERDITDFINTKGNLPDNAADSDMVMSKTRVLRHNNKKDATPCLMSSKANGSPTHHAPLKFTPTKIPSLRSSPLGSNVAMFSSTGIRTAYTTLASAPKLDAPGIGGMDIFGPLLDPAKASKRNEFIPPPSDTLQTATLLALRHDEWEYAPTRMYGPRHYAWESTSHGSADKVPERLTEKHLLGKLLLQNLPEWQEGGRAYVDECARYIYNLWHDTQVPYISVDATLMVPAATRPVSARGSEKRDRMVYDGPGQFIQSALDTQLTDSTTKTDLPGLPMLQEYTRPRTSSYDAGTIGNTTPLPALFQADDIKYPAALLEGLDEQKEPVSMDYVDWRNYFRSKYNDGTVTPAEITRLGYIVGAFRRLVNDAATLREVIASKAVSLVKNCRACRYKGSEDTARLNILLPVETKPDPKKPAERHVIPDNWNAQFEDGGPVTRAEIQKITEIFPGIFATALEDPFYVYPYEDEEYNTSVNDMIQLSNQVRELAYYIAVSRSAFGSLMLYRAVMVMHTFCRPELRTEDVVTARAGELTGITPREYALLCLLINADTLRNAITKFQTNDATLDSFHVGILTHLEQAFPKPSVATKPKEEVLPSAGPLAVLYDAMCCGLANTVSYTAEANQGS